MAIRAVDTDELHAGAEKLYEAMGDVVDGLRPLVKLKFASVLRDRPEWDELDEDVQDAFIELRSRL